MPAETVRVEPIALMPTPAGCAVFLGDGQKVITLYIDPSIGASINTVLANDVPPRPLTHDLITDAMHAMGGRMLRALIIKIEDEIHYARIFFEAQNEIMERKIIELNARPSDCIALAVRSGSPIYYVKEVWEKLEDMSHILEQMKQEND